MGELKKAVHHIQIQYNTRQTETIEDRLRSFSTTDVRLVSEQNKRLWVQIPHRNFYLEDKSDLIKTTTCIQCQQDSIAQRKHTRPSHAPKWPWVRIPQTTQDIHYNILTSCDINFQTNTKQYEHTMLPTSTTAAYRPRLQHTKRITFSQYTLDSVKRLMKKTLQEPFDQFMHTSIQTSIYNFLSQTLHFRLQNSNPIFKQL